MRNTAGRRMIVRKALGLFGLLLLCGAFSQVADGQRRERTADKWKPIHYDVSLSLNEQLSEISSAKTEITLQVLQASVANIDLDFGDLPIDSIGVSDKAARFERAAGLLTVILPEVARQNQRIKVVVAYHGRPKDGLVFANDRDGKLSVTGDNWPNRVHQWIPCLDHPSAKASVTFTVSAPQRDVVVANGKFVNLTRNGEISTWRFEESEPIPPYCMVIVVNQGARLDTPYQAIPLSYYVTERDRAYALKGFSSAPDAVSFFSQTIAKYPYEKLALIIGATRFGGMENSSAIVFTSTLFDLRANEKMSARFGIPQRIEDVVAHEIAHQWFGDSVTESTWADLWLSEGFATYFAGLFLEKYEGEAAFRDYMQSAASRYFAYEKQRTAPIHDTETEDLLKLLNPNNYEKGAWVLHMLRRQMGDVAFFNGLRAYYNAHRGANAGTEDLRQALEKASGRDLKAFFARWVYESGHPQYQMHWNWREGHLTITLEQKQAGEPFLDPVPIEIEVNGKRQQVKLIPTSRLTTTEISLDAKPTTFQIDPDETILKEVLAN